MTDPRTATSGRDRGDRASDVLSAFGRAAFGWAVRRKLWVSAGVASLGLVTGTLLGIPLNPSAIALLYFSALAIYSIDDVFDASLDVPRRAVPVRSIAYTVVGLLVVCVALHAAPPSTRVLVTVGGLVCLGYGAPLPLARLRRLKEIPGIKGWWIAGAVTTATIGVPLSYQPWPVGLPGECAGLAGVLFVVTYTNVQLFDIRDLRRDARSGVPTLPCLIGVERTKWLLFGVLALTASALATLSLAGLVSWHPVYWVGIGLSVVSVARLGPATPRLIFDLWADGALIVLGLLSVVLGSLA